VEQCTSPARKNLVRAPDTAPVKTH